MTSTFVLVAVLGANPMFAELEETLDNLTLGPTASAHALYDRNGFAPAFGAGFELIWFDLEKVYEPRCLEHRRREREQLGAQDGNVVDDLIGAAQQECPATDSYLVLYANLGVELEVAVRAQRELSLRSWGTLLNLWRTLGVGLTGSVAFGDRGGGTALGLRLGAELSWQQRFGRKGFRPVLQPFIRGELVILGREQFTDQLGAGVRFVFDL